MRVNVVTLIIEKMKENRLRWHGYVLRREETGAVKLVMGMYI